MKKNRRLYGLFLTGLCFCCLAAPVAINVFYFHEGRNAELSAALGLLMLNLGFFVGFSRLNSPLARSMGIAFGLLLIVAKLFVNLFTIFLLIGLQAVRTQLFVAEFFAGYSVLLVGGLIFLHWNSKRF